MFGGLLGYEDFMVTSTEESSWRGSPKFLRQLVHAVAVAGTCGTTAVHE